MIAGAWLRCKSRFRLFVSRALQWAECAWANVGMCYNWRPYWGYWSASQLPFARLRPAITGIMISARLECRCLRFPLIVANVVTAFFFFSFSHFYIHHIQLANFVWLFGFFGIVQPRCPCLPPFSTRECVCVCLCGAACM